MALVADETRPVFDTTQIAKGYLVYAKHRSWDEGLGGIVTSVKPDTVTVQYHPKIGNVMNHFHIPAKEVADGQWEIRWSEDLTEIGSVEIASEETEGEDEGS